MSSKREEERNEKIIRGLMKLPPNRRCINCNSLRTASSGSFGSFDSSSMSFRSVNSLGLPEVGSEPAQSAEISHEKSSSFQSLPQSSGSMTFDGLDLFSAPFAPENGTFTSPTGSSSQLPQLAESVNVVQQSPISSVSLFTEQQPSQIPEPLPLELFVALSQQQSAVSSHGKASDAVMPNSGGWATFDMPPNVVPMGTENSSAAAVPSSDGNNLGNSNPFSIYQNSSYEGPIGHEHPSSTHTFGHENPQNIEATINNTHFWNAFDDSAGGQPTQDLLKINGQTAVHSTSDAYKSLGFGVYEALNNDGTVRAADVGEPPSSSLSSDFSMVLNDFPMVAAVAGTDPFAIDNKPTNPFDLSYDPDMESSNMSQFWNMSSLQAALPSTQMPTSYVGGVEESWFPQNSVSSYVPGGVSFDPTSGPLGFIAGQAASAPVQTVHTQGPVASVGGNPFA
ncbi:UNVERIFIED_CONTAM: putative ADP-ribosylation factor GTPase-activating protein AGD14 [Sesamum radiatum]|uniref:ADP-ribosylation factor GTPase-activating protein AGD14 n=1 Tax=Sesamum radiatum TaxID=300843 RepID=A0AAW2TJP5_SESRA